MSDPRSLTPEIDFRRGISYAGGLVSIGVIYFALAKGGLALASIHPSATPIWPPTGLALAAGLLWGYRSWPANFTAGGEGHVETARPGVPATSVSAGNPRSERVCGFPLNSSLAG